MSTLAPETSRPSHGRAPVFLITWMLARPSAATPATVVLPIVAFAVTSALMMTTVGALRYFWGSDDEYWVMFQDFTLIMLALLLVPLTTLGGAAARLSARRRDDRLATLRLLGATARTVALITVIESTALAVVGALGGIVLHAVTTPLLGLIHFHGAPFGPTALWAGPLGILGVLGGVALLAAVSAAIGLRSVVVSPLGVRQRQQAARVSWIRPVLGVVLIVVAFLAAVAGGAGAGIAVIVVAFGLAVGVLGIIGPWAIALFARRRLRVAKTAESLLAARSILESPKAAWRLVGGIAMTSFIAVVGGGGLALMDSIGSSSWEPTFVDDFRTGIFSTLLASFLMVACSVGVGQAAAVLDRRDLYVSLDRMGAPVATMDAARVRAVMSPLVFVTVGSSLLGAIIVLPLLGLATVIAPLSVVVIIACLVAGVALVRLSLLATRPVLTGVLAQAERPLG